MSILLFLVQFLLLAETSNGFSSSFPPSLTLFPNSPVKKSLIVNRKGIMGSGLDAALLLSNKKRQTVFKQDVAKRFPSIPPKVLDICMDALSSSFANVAPSDLKKALKPGGLEKLCPKIKATVVKSLKTQQMIKDIPLSDDDKTKLLEFIVKLSLDYLLEDAQVALMAPAMKLQMLEREQYETRRYMSVWELAWYRLRFFPVRSIGFVLLITWAGFLTSQYYRDTALISTLATATGQILAGATVVAQKAASLATSVSKR
jgi:hypothetical protein